MVMAFPWRKVKNRKISQFVNDHLHNSRKRRDGSSLVVETGFPTSLVDLFMKNREKLKKSSKKKQNNAPSVVLDDDDDSGFREMIPVIVPSVSCSDADVDVGLSDEIEINTVTERDTNSSSSFLVVLKMFLVVFFVLGTNRLTMGITISAFLLFFLDYIGNHTKRLCFWRSPDDQNGGILMQEEEEKNPRFRDTEIVDDLAIKMDEIEEVTESSSSQEVQKEILMDKEDLKLKKESKKAKMKAKIKKFFAKRFKGRRKEKTEQVNQSDNETPSQSVGGLPSISTPNRRVEDTAPTVASSDKSIQSSEVQEARDTRGNRGAKESGGIWRFSLFCLIILVGLIGGRPFSILLTIFAFFLLKFVENRRCS